MSSTITLTINLGNDAMQSPQNVAEALNRVAERMWHKSQFFTDEGGTVLDVNGNAVGAWHFNEEV